MPIYRLGKRREATMFKSQLYLKFVKQYLDEILGFAPTTDSFHEAHRADTIFLKKGDPSGREYYLEAKNTILKLSNTNFAKEILNYLLDWLHLPVEKRGYLFIFANELESSSDTEFSFDNLFDNQYDKDEIMRYVKKYLSTLKPRQQKYLEETNENDIIAFFSEIHLHEVDTNFLKDTIEEERKDSVYYIPNYADKVYRESLRLRNPIQRETTLTLNLIPFKPPNNIYVAQTKCKTKKGIYGYYDEKNVEIPPFWFDPEKNRLYSFDRITPNHPLMDIIEGDISQISSDREDLSLTFKIQLINEHLRRYLWKKGLRRVPETSDYFFEAIKKDGKFVDRNCLRSDGTSKRVTRPLFDPPESDNLNFIFHETSAEIKSIFLWGQFFINIVPTRIYSNDGISPIEGDNKDRIDRMFRQYDRNSHRSTAVRFFADYLFISNKFEREKENWFEEFKFEPLLQLKFDRVPKTYEIDQTVLGEFL